MKMLLLKYVIFLSSTVSIVYPLPLSTLTEVGVVLCGSAGDPAGEEPRGAGELHAETRGERH